MEALIKNWITEAITAVEENSKKAYPNCEANHRTLLVSQGRKYTKLIIADANNPTNNRSVYAFLDKEGNIYKAANWKTPAKGIRGTVSSIDPTSLEASTHWLYRR